MSTPAIIEALEKRALTEVVNKREMGKKALTAMLFPPARELNLTQEWVQVDELTGTVGMAPMVEKNGKAISVGQLNGQGYILQTPNINIKRTLTCSELLLKRRAGEGIFAPNGVDVYKDAMESQIADDLEFMEESVRNRQEWMVSQLIQGEISYQVEGGASWKVTTAKPAGNTFTVGTLWTAADPTPLNDIKAAKRLVQPYSAPGFQVAVCGQNASDAISAMLEEGTITAIKSDSGIVAGMGDLIADYQANGMLYLGTFGGIPFFEYAASYLDDNTGSSTPHIRTDYVEFLTTAQPQTRVMYNGAILDAEAIMAGMHIARRFATSDLDKDVGTYVGYLKARPLPWLKRPEWNVSMKVA
jgi:hypothetical protein